MTKFNLLLPFALFLLMSCSQEGVIIADGELLLDGKWKLIEYCQSPGDASCPKQEPDYNEIYEFNGNSFTLESKDISCTGSFEIREQNLLKVIDFSNSNNGDSGCFDREYYLNIIDNNHININPFCIEECTYLYERQ